MIISFFVFPGKYRFLKAKTLLKKYFPKYFPKLLNYFPSYSIIYLRIKKGAVSMDSVMADRKVVFLKIDDILPNRFQPRIKFDEQALKELSESIKEHGVLSPITVRPLGNKFEIIAGERRYKASTMAGLTEIPAMVVNMNDKESAEIALIENVQRKDLTPIEEAISYKKIFDMNIGISQEMLAKKLGKSQSAIANKLRLLNLSDEVQEALLENRISERHARSLLRIKDKKIQNILLDKIIKERLTVRRTDEEVIKMLNNNKDIEILDFEDQNAPIKNENINNPLNRFESLYNLPKTPIIEDKEDEFIPRIPDVTSFEMPPFKDVEEKKENDLEDTITISRDSINEEKNMTPTDTPKINPGFLDISKIEKEANNINENKPKLSLEELLKMPDKPTKEEPEETFEPINNNRFFTMVEDEDNSGNTDVRFEANELSSKMPDMDFNTRFVPQEKSLFERLEEKENEPEEKTELSGFNNEIFNTVAQPKEEKDEELKTNTFDSNMFNFGNLFAESNPVDQNVEPQNLFNNEPLNLGNEDLPHGDIIEDEEDVSEEVVTPKEEFKPVPPMGYTPENITPSYEEPEYTPVYDLDEPVTMEKHDNSKYGAADLKTIINTIRKCAETIEKYGYVIDTEEFDFEDMYQVIFKIEKKH